MLEERYACSPTINQKNRWRNKCEGCDHASGINTLPSGNPLPYLICTSPNPTLTNVNYCTEYRYEAVVLPSTDFPADIPKIMLISILHPSKVLAFLWKVLIFLHYILPKLSWKCSLSVPWIITTWLTTLPTLILWSHMLNECLCMHVILKPNSLVIFNLSGYQTWSVLVYNVN